MDQITSKIRTSRVTIADVAERAGVSIKTVSRVTNNEPNVRPATRAKVIRAIADLDYLPDPSARSLASRRSHLVGLLYDNPSASYLVSIQNGALRASRAAGYDLIIHPCDYRADSLAVDLERMVRQSNVDGLVLTPPLSDMPGIVGLLDRLKTPFVRVAPADGDDRDRAVYTNDESVCAEMTRYLHSLGHERIGFIIGHPDHGAVLKRFDGYRQGMHECGLDMHEDLVAQGYNSFESGLECAHALLGTARRPTAIFASNDDMAAGVIRVAHELGLRVPDELSVAGFDDVPLASQLWPPLTTIRQPMEAMAKTAAELLLLNMGRHSDGHEPERTIASELIVRESTGPAPP